MYETGVYNYLQANIVKYYEEMAIKQNAIEVEKLSQKFENHDSEENSSDIEDLALSHLKVAFELLFIGLSITISILFIEILVKYILSKCIKFGKSSKFEDPQKFLHKNLIKSQFRHRIAIY
jgi:hypothetical protein